MYQILEEVPKSLSALGSGVGSLWKLVKDVQKQFALKREIQEKDGQQGIFFFLCFTLFQYLYQSGLILLGIGGFLAVSGGLLKIFQASWAPSMLVSLYENYSVQLLGGALLWGLISTLNVFSWIVILVLEFVPPNWFAFRESAGWHNLKQFAMPLEHPRPLFIRKEGIEQLADSVTIRLMAAGAGAANFAAKPIQLSDDERANTALFGCLIEKEYKVQQWGRRDWAPFYAAVAAAQDGATRIVSPTYLNVHGRNVDFYGTLRQAVNQQFPEGPDLPDSPVVMNHLSEAVELLTTRYSGSARNFALGSWTATPSLRLAFERAQHFKPLDRQSMVPQFLKLAVRWDVWPGVEAGNFIYPYAQSLALLILEDRALVTLDAADKFAFKDAGELYAYREAMRRTVKSVEKILSTSNRAEHRDYFRQLSSAGHPVEWELAARADFTLWSLSSEMMAANEFTRWEIEGNGFIVKKN